MCIYIYTYLFIPYIHTCFYLIFIFICCIFISLIVFDVNAVPFVTATCYDLSKRGMEESREAKRVVK